jgi:hypothetical protein
MLAIVAFVLLVFVYSLLSKRLEGTVLSPPVVFALAGIALVLVAPGPVKSEVQGKGWLG